MFLTGLVARRPEVKAPADLVSGEGHPLLVSTRVGEKAALWGLFCYGTNLTREGCALTTSSLPKSLQIPSQWGLGF